MRVFCLLNGDRTVASARERVLRYQDDLAREGVTLDVHVAGDVRPGIAGRAKYWLDLSRRVLRADVILIHRVPLSPRERSVIRASGKPAIFDVDDAIWLSMQGGPSSRVDDLRETIRLCRAARAGNEALARYLRPLVADVRLAPTCVPPAPAREPADGPFRVGWVGHSVNLPYLDLCAPALAQVPGLRLVVVADRPPPIPDVEFHEWSVGCEERIVPTFDAGIMPLPDTEWTRGKCGYKILLCLSHAVPVVASPVGANLEILEDGRTGFFARTPEEWRARLTELARDPGLRVRLGRAGRASIEGRYDTARGLRDWLRDLRETAR